MWVKGSDHLDLSTYTGNVDLDLKKVIEWPWNLRKWTLFHMWNMVYNRVFGPSSCCNIMKDLQIPWWPWPLLNVPRSKFGLRVISLVQMYCHEIRVNDWHGIVPFHRSMSIWPWPYVKVKSRSWHRLFEKSTCYLLARICTQFLQITLSIIWPRDLRSRSVTV